MSIFIRTVPNVMAYYGCTAEAAQRYIDLRNEGYRPQVAALMAGLTNPPDPEAPRVMLRARHLNQTEQEE